MHFCKWESIVCTINFTKVNQSTDANSEGYNPFFSVKLNSRSLYKKCTTTCVKRETRNS